MTSTLTSPLAPAALNTPGQATADGALAEIDDALGDITAPAPGSGVSLSV